MLPLVIRAIRERIKALEIEVDLFTEEIAVINRAPGHDELIEPQLPLLRNVKVCLHDVLLFYYEKLLKCKEKSGKLIQQHLEICRTKKFLVLINELYGHQSALNTLVGRDYLKYSRDFNIPDDMQLRMLQLVFPFEFAFQLVTSKRFLRLFIRTVEEYDPEFHEEAIKKLFTFISEERPGSPIDFFTADSPLFFTLAEHLLTIFVRDSMFAVDWQPLEHLSIFQKCSLIAKQNAQVFGLDLRRVNLASEEFDRLSALDRPSDQKKFNKPLEKRLGEREATISINSGLKCFLHVAIEIKRMKCQPSPSGLLCVLSTAVNWLTRALTIDGNHIGADEILHFFSYMISVVGFEHLPSMVSFVEHFVDTGLAVTRFGYLLTQLEAALEYIQQRLLPVPPFLVFPVSTVPSRFVSEITCGERVIMKGFAVYAFPTFTPDYSDLFSAMLQYTGNPNHTAVCHQFTAKSTLGFRDFAEFDTIPTLDGTIFQLSDDFIQQHDMIFVNDGKYDDHITDVILASALLKMDSEVNSLRIDDIDKVYQDIRRRWKLGREDPWLEVQRIVCEIQKGLEVELNGIMNWQTVEAIVKFGARNGGLTRSLYRDIIRR
jgi:hypothetical protein